MKFGILHRSLLLLTGCFFSLATFGQDTTYFLMGASSSEKDGEIISFSVVYKDSLNPYKQKTCDFYKSGTLKSEFYQYGEEGSQKLEGMYRMWYPSGQLKCQGYYENGFLEGELLSYWPKGQLRRKESYKKGKVIKGEYYTENGELDPVYVPFFTPPVFSNSVNGSIGFNEYYFQHIRFPRRVMHEMDRIEVVLEITINKKGRICNTRIIEPAAKEFNDEALRLVTHMPRWKPALLEGEPVFYQIQVIVPFSHELYQIQKNRRVPTRIRTKSEDYPLFNSAPFNREERVQGYK